MAKTVIGGTRDFFAVENKFFERGISKMTAAIEAMIEYRKIEDWTWKTNHAVRGSGKPNQMNQ